MNLPIPAIPQTSAENLIYCLSTFKDILDLLIQVHKMPNWLAINRQMDCNLYFTISLMVISSELDSLLTIHGVHCEIYESELKETSFSFIHAIDEPNIQAITRGRFSGRLF